MFGGVSGQTLSDTWCLSTAVPAELTSYAPGCPGTLGVPALAAAPYSLPWLGDAFTVRVTGIAPARPALLLLGGSRTVWGTSALPLSLASLGMPGCSLHASIDVAVPLTGGALTLQVPATPALAGQSLFEQALVSDPAANASGLTVSNACAARLGIR